MYTVYTQDPQKHHISIIFASTSQSHCIKFFGFGIFNILFNFVIPYCRMKHHKFRQLKGNIESEIEMSCVCMFTHLRWMREKKNLSSTKILSFAYKFILSWVVFFFNGVFALSFIIIFVVAVRASFLFFQHRTHRLFVWRNWIGLSLCVCVSPIERFWWLVFPFLLLVFLG